MLGGGFDNPASAEDWTRWEQASDLKARLERYRNEMVNRSYTGVPLDRIEVARIDKQITALEHILVTIASKTRKRNPEPHIVAEYRGFHGAEPHERQVDVPEPRGPLMKVGRLLEIVYEPETPSKLKGREYQHAFGDAGGHKVFKDKPLLATDGHDLFVIRDKSPYNFAGQPNERGFSGIIS